MGPGDTSQLGAAFLGGLSAAALVYAVAAGVSLTPVRLVLAGMAVTLALSALAAVLLLLFQQKTAGLFFWGQGTLVQTGSSDVVAAWPRLVAAGMAALLLARALDVLSLGDDLARALGLAVARVRLGALALAVFLSATAVTLTGPIAFVGLVAPHLVRLSGVTRHRLLLPGAAVWGGVLLIGADAVARGVRNTSLSSELPAGVVTALVGAPFFVWLARRAGDTPPEAPSSPVRTARTGGGRGYVTALVGAGAALAAAGTAGLVLGDVRVPLGELTAVLGGHGSPLGTQVLLQLRLPRVLVAALAGASLAVSGTLLQAVTRNPLVAPSVVGISGGAGLGALAVLLVLPGVPVGLLPVAAFIGGLAAFGLVYGVSWRGGIAPTRLLLVGVAVSAFCTSAINYLVVGADLRLAQALTWLSGSTYARSWSDLAALLAWPALLLPLAWLGGRQLDVLALGERLPRTLGMRLEQVRAALLALAVLLASAAASVVGTISFVGLVAPHATRLLVGGRNRRVIPLAALLGATLVVLADVIGRVVLAPKEVPSGQVTALIGAPYFVWLLWRSRRRAA